jgi:glycosyltransferase involved in cell wall biosynthesis
VATPSIREELERHGFRNLSYWSRGVDTDLFQMRPGEGVTPGWPEPPELKGLARPIFLNVGRVAVEKNIEAFAKLDLPGSKVVVGDGPSREELSVQYPDVVFTGARFGETLAAYFAWSDVFVFPSLTDTFGLVILEAMATGSPVAAYPAPGPIDLIPGSGAGVCDPDLKKACLECLEIDRQTVRKFAEGFSWRAAAEQFVANLEPYPEPQKTRLWKRLRRLARFRRRATQPSPGLDLGA